MASAKVIDLLAATCFYSSKILKLTPTFFYKLNNSQWIVSSVRNKKRIKSMWCSILIGSLIISITELYLSFYRSKSKKLIQVLYHAFQLFTKAACYSCIWIFNKKSVDIPSFFNCICKQNGILNFESFQAESKQRKNFSDLKLFQVFAFFIALTFFIFLLVILPFVSLSLPNVHEALCFQVLFLSCDSISFKLYLLVIQMPCVVPMSAIAPLACVSSLVTLKEINLSLEKLR